MGGSLKFEVWVEWSGGGGCLPSTKRLPTEALEGLLLRVSALVALDVLESAEALLAVATGQRLRLLPAGVVVDVGCVALAGSVGSRERHGG